MKTILAATDFTPSSTNACRYAALLAQKMKCRLILFNLYETIPFHATTGLYLLAQKQQYGINAERLEDLICELKQEFPQLNIDYLVTTGNFKKAIKNFISSHSVEAAVLGLDAKEKAIRYIYGSHTTDIAGKLACPVITVPSSFQQHQLSHIVLAVDNSEELLKTSLKELESVVTHTKAQADVLHIHTPHEVFEPAVREIKIGKKIRLVKTIKAPGMEAGVKRYCKKEKCDLIAIISKRHSILYNFFAESHTKKMIFAANVPVMAIHT